jgi:hypothetical protein
VEQHAGAAQHAHQLLEFSPLSTSSSIASEWLWCLEMAVRPRSWIRTERGVALVVLEMPAMGLCVKIVVRARVVSE